MDEHSDTDKLDFSESTTDTPKPVRKRTGGGRFPIRPSVSGVDLDSAGNASNSPTPARPALKSSKTMHLTQTTRNTSVRPSVEPLISKDRHRSNSESQMSTNRRQKRMGIHMSRGGSGNSSAEISLDGVDLNKEPRSTHARGTSAGSLLNQVLQGHGVTDSSGPESPVTTDLSRSASQYAGHGRLSSLPENKRKSQYSEPFVELADTIVFSMTQVEAPLKRMVTAAKSSGSRRRSLERSYHSAFACKGDLSEALYNLETFDEEDGGKRKSVLSVREQCEMCIRNYQKLLDALQSHVNSVVDNTRPRELRMMMHITFGVMLEVKSLTSKINDVVTIRQESRECKPAVQVSKPERLEGRLQERTVEVPARQASNSPRPKTSLRIKDRGRIAAHHHHQSSNVNKPLPTPRSARSTSGASQLSRRPSYASSNTRPQDAYNLPTPSLTHSNSFLSTASTDAMDEYEEDQLFEDIFTKLNDACNKSLQGLPMCKKIFTLLRKGPREATNHIHGAEQVYDRFLQHCDYALEACNELKKRLKTLKVREPQARDHIEFWQVCTAFTKAYFVFATTLRDSHYPGLVPDQVRTLLRPVQKGVKEASNLIDNSPWCHLAVHGPNSAGPSPAVSGVLPFSMTNPTPPVVAPPAKDLPPRPNNPYAYTNGLGLQTSWGSSTTLTRSDTLGSNHSATGAYEGGTLRAMPTPHQTYVNGMSTPGELSRSHSRAGRPPPPPAPTSNPSFNSSFGSNGSFGSSHYAEPPPMDNRAHDSRFAPVADPRYTSSEPRYTPVDGPLSGTRSGYSSGYGTPLPVTPMSAALGPAAKATANSENEGTIRRAGGGVHEKQNSWESVNGHSNGGGQGWYNGNSNGSTTGYGHGATHAYSNGVSPHNGLNGAGGSTTSLVNISASLRSGLGGPGGVERIERPERPDILPRSVSAAGYYPSSVPARMGSRNVSRSASQRR